MGDNCIVGSGGFDYPGEPGPYWTTNWGDALADLARAAGVEPSLQLAMFVDGDELDHKRGFPSVPIPEGTTPRRAFESFLAAQRKKGARRAARALGFDTEDVEFDDVEEVSFTGRVECRIETAGLRALADRFAHKLGEPASKNWRQRFGQQERVLDWLSSLAKSKAWHEHFALAVIAHAAKSGARKVSLEEDEPSWDDVL
ncbi:MAG: hypothetical protein U0271_43500 [Polyangiaceae bacterium]